MGTISYIWKPAHESAYTHGRKLPISSIILHSSCGHEDGDLIALTGGDPGHPVSSHWYVDKSGTIFHLVNNSDTAWHAGTVKDPKYSNAASIGIEQEHLDGEEEWPLIQIEATARLCVALRQRYGNIEIAHHADVAIPHGRKTDPMFFPSDVFWDAYSDAAKENWTFQQVQEQA